MKKYISQTINTELLFKGYTFSLFIFYLSFMAHQDYFTHFETSQSLGGVKTGDPQEKPPDPPPPASRTWLVSRDPSYTRTHSGEMTSDSER